ncbi:hypothetical protein RHABOEDO_000805 [Candidatus Rhabdochlamydia oedothoracis]|uniref:Uncharacterized protein n=1 Tax=Candidatus Rhabdochlamydia oedothoracis TaxID=2720720 RepID=A0ABX8V072_9BACT|nr:MULTISPECIES: hypothetical protein [Rhabdochlamydia]KAG6559715.1 hypothetical protein RHOW815_000256 [Candidatus Rhabdochlamydia sp. W815]MCL6755732.1 hypothetical protein [Candidatus Rhabdochlamydia oedothoracis]QYF48614.1 hypothetical protein RHABOEDO_000805 [Candidatus Rhabdochlamydia oedothoracis]
MTITSSNFPNHPVLLHLKEELHKSPADFENKKKLYYVATVISSLVATAFFLSFIPLQTMMLPFWLSIAGAITTQFSGMFFLKTASDMIQNAEEMGKVANDLREMQNTYQRDQKTSFSEPEKVIMSHASLVEKKYIEAEARLQELIHTNLSSPKSRLEEIIQFQHQILLLKIDLCFKVALFDTVAAGNLSCLREKKDLLIISDQDPLKRNQIQGLNEILHNKLTIEPLIRFRNTFDTLSGSSTNLIDDYPETLYHDAVANITPEALVRHIFTFMNGPHFKIFSKVEQ